MLEVFWKSEFISGLDSSAAATGLPRNPLMFTFPIMRNGTFGTRVLAIILVTSTTITRSPVKLTMEHSKQHSGLSHALFCVECASRGYHRALHGTES
jgi:hypothetical protein